MAQNEVVKNPLATVQSLLEKYKSQIAMALPKHMTPERMIRVALSACGATPKLLQCDPYTVCGSIVQASIMGLEPNSNLGECFLVPYWNSKAKGGRGGLDCQLQIGYKGHVKLARNSGEISMVDAQPVYSNDDFDFEKGKDPWLRHKRPKTGPRGELLGYWAGFTTRDGVFNFEYMNMDELNEHRDKFTKSRDKNEKIYGPWVDNPDWMYRKTPLIQVLKLAPKSVDRNLATALALEDRANAGLSQQFSVEVPLELNPPPEPEPEPEPTTETKQPQRKSEAAAAEANRPATDAAWGEVVKVYGGEERAVEALVQMGFKDGWSQVNVGDRSAVAMRLIEEARKGNGTGTRSA